MVQSVGEALQQFDNQFEEVFELGLPYTEQELGRAILTEFPKLIPMAVGILLFMLIIVMRSASAAILPLLTSGFSIFFTLAFMAFVGIPINLLTFMVPILVIVIGSTEDVHILSEYMEGVHEYRARSLAINYMARTIGTAILLTSLTTFLGFISISISRVIVLRQFGIAAGFALFINPITTILLAPVYLKFFGSKKYQTQKKEGASSKFLKKMSNLLLYLIHNQKGLTLTILIGGAVVLGAFSLRIVVDNDFVSFFKPSSAIPTRMNRIAEGIAGGSNFNIRISTGQPNGFHNPVYLNQMEELIERLNSKQIDGKRAFDKIISINDYLKLTHREMNFSDETFFKIPDESDLIAQYSLFMGDEEPQNYVSFDWSEANIIVRHNVSSSHKINNLVEEIYDDMEEIMDPFLQYEITGKLILINRAATTIVTSQLQGLLLLSVVIFLVMTIMFTNVKAGFLALIPNMFPVAVFFGIMGIFGIPLNVGTCLVAAIAIGISVDDTIHFMARFNKEMRNYSSKKDAIRAVVEAEVQPVVSTSLSLFLLFGIFATANLTLVIYFGILSAIVMICALVADLLLTPILLTSVQLATIQELTSLKLNTELQKSPLLQGLSMWGIKKIALFGNLRDAQKDDLLIKQGDEGNEMYILLDGKVEVTRFNEEEKKEVVIATLGPGDIIGEQSLLENVPRSASVRALSATRFVMYDWEGLRRIEKSAKKSASQVYKNLAAILSNRLRDTTERLF